MGLTAYYTQKRDNYKFSPSDASMLSLFDSRMMAYQCQEIRMSNYLTFNSSIPPGGKIFTIFSPFEASMPSDTGSRGFYRRIRILS